MWRAALFLQIYSFHFHRNENENEKFNGNVMNQDVGLFVFSRRALRGNFGVDFLADHFSEEVYIKNEIRYGGIGHIFLLKK